MSEPRVHVRRPEPPWRRPEAARSECGRPAGAATTISRDRLREIVRDARENPRDARFSTVITGEAKRVLPSGVTIEERPKVVLLHEGRAICQTCWESAGRHRDWEGDPVAVIARDQDARWNGEGEPAETRRELRALALLAEAHRQEYENLRDWLELVPGDGHRWLDPPPG